MSSGTSQGTHGQWHWWHGTKGYLLSDEDTKTLREFTTRDAMINWLFVQGYKETARHISGLQ